MVSFSHFRALGVKDMLRETSRNELDEDRFEPDVDYLRLIIAASKKLPPAVARADFSKIYDRVLDERAIQALADPDSCSQEDAKERCRVRRNALAPYSGKRLICVMIDLPGVFYTIEINPALHTVVYWECLAT